MPSPTCGQCGAELSDKTTARYAVRIEPRWIARFTYPTGSADKSWEASEGIAIASHCKAIVGDIPYLWSSKDSAVFIADKAGGACVGICDGCVPKAPKQTRRKSAKKNEDLGEED
jgi:hypothetical protein